MSHPESGSGHVSLEQGEMGADKRSTDTRDYKSKIPQGYVDGVRQLRKLGKNVVEHHFYCEGAISRADAGLGLGGKLHTVDKDGVKKEKAKQAAEDFLSAATDEEAYFAVESNYPLGVMHSFFGRPELLNLISTQEHIEGTEHRYQVNEATEILERMGVPDGKIRKLRPQIDVLMPGEKMQVPPSIEITRDEQGYKIVGPEMEA